MEDKLFFKSDSGRECYARVFNDQGQVFDFDDNEFKALASATEPYVTMTEYSDMDGSGRSGYLATVELSLFNDSSAYKTFMYQVYDNGTPNDGDLAISTPTIFAVVAGMNPVSAVPLALWESTIGRIVAASAGGKITRRPITGNSFENDLYHPIDGELVSTITVDRSGNRSAVSTEE